MRQDRDIETLSHQTSRRTLSTIKNAILVMILLNVTVGVLNLRLSSRFASLAGTNFREVIVLWFAGIDITEQYSGLFVEATERWITGLLQFAMAIIFSVLMAITLRQSEGKRRILQ